MQVLTMIPSPKVQVGFGRKLVPKRVKFRPLEFCSAELGLTLVRVGGGPGTQVTTLKPFGKVAEPPSGLVTMILLEPTGASY